MMADTPMARTHICKTDTRDSYGYPFQCLHSIEDLTLFNTGEAPFGSSAYYSRTHASHNNIWIEGYFRCQQA